jgi:crotonobetainyl-CoA:carnitine CoA-transferase CaiB-like acyl-CoA transferase
VRGEGLAGVRVIDMTEGVAGPYAATLLGDMGADVVKVERLEGDWGRTSGKEGPAGLNPHFVALNRNKRAVGLDMRSSGADEVMRRLLERADVIISNFRPGVMEQLELGYKDCTRINPALIYCTISAFGQEGGYSRLPGSDTIMQAISGLMDITGEPTGPPLRISFTLIDLAAALFAVQGILLALYEGNEKGRRVEVSLLNASLALQNAPFTGFLVEGILPGRQGNQNPALSPAGAFRTSDGKYIALAVLRESHWAKFCKAISRPDLERDPRFSSNARRLENRPELNEILESLFETKDRTEWLSTLGEADIICSPVNSYQDLMDDPELAKAVTILELDLSSGPMRTVGNPVQVDDQHFGARISPPQLGEHTTEILSELSFTQREIEELLQRQVVFQN